MDKTDAIMDLIAGYDTYTEADELNLTTATDAPGSSPACASFGVSAVTSMFSARTVTDGC